MTTPLKSLYWLLTLLVTAPLQALVVDDTTTLNDTPPSNGAPWFNVGTDGGASGVYLRNGWVVSARHVYGGTTSGKIKFDGTTYSSGTIFQLTNPDLSLSDIVLFNIGSKPSSALDVDLLPATPNLGTSFTMIGYGAKRGGGLSSISTSTGPRNGYYWDASNGVSKSWGNNVRNSSPLSMPFIGTYSIQAFNTTCRATGLTGRAQAALGDSGGGVFLKVGDVWVLAGTMHGIGGFAGQPDGTAVDGNITAIADISAYAEQINSKLNSGVATPVLTNVSPNTFAASNDPRTLFFSGAGFVNGAKIQIATSNDFNNFNDTTIAGNFISSSTMTLSVSANSPTTWKFRVVNPDGQPSAAITVTVNPQTFSNWLTSYPSLTGNNALTIADPDYDGLTNLQEYAFGSDPTQTASANLPLLGTEIIANQPYLTLSYQKDTTKTDIVYQAQMNTDLTTTWTNIADAVVSSSGTLQERKVSILMDEPKKFLRIQIVK